MADGTDADTPPEEKRPVAKLSPAQLGANIGRNILLTLSDIAANVSRVVQQGIDPATGKALSCSADDVRRYWTPEQTAAIDEFISNFLVEPEPSAGPATSTAGSPSAR